MRRTALTCTCGRFQLDDDVAAVVTLRSDRLRQWRLRNSLPATAVILQALGTGAAPQQPPPELSALVAKARLAQPVAWCNGEFRSGRPHAFAAAIPAENGSGGRYVVLEADALAAEIAAFIEGADLSCYTRSEAEKLNATIRQSETIQGEIAPRWNSTVICGFIDDTTAECWQYSDAEKAFVKIGGWTT